MSHIFYLGIHDTEDRKHCLDLAEEANLDVSMITKRVVEIIQTSDNIDFNLALDSQFDNTISEVHVCMKSSRIG